jgi:ATP-dependent Clp protease adapter protein ClpS
MGIETPNMFCAARNRGKTDDPPSQASARGQARGFCVCGLEIFNDDRTPMEFVVSVLRCEQRETIYS